MLHIPKVPESLIMLPTDEQEPPQQNRELDVGAYQFIWERGYPPLQCCDLTTPDKSVKCMLDQACCLREIGGRQRVVNGVARQAMLLIPCARAPVEFWYERRMCALQAGGATLLRRAGGSDTRVWCHPSA